MAGRGCLGNTLLAYCAINIGIGLGLVACGIWMHAAPDVYAYITVFVRSTNDKSLVAAAALILTAGIILSLLSLLGVFGVLKRNVLMMSAYMWLLPLVIIMGVVAGFMTVALYYDSHLDVKQAMLGQLSTYYDWESHIGKAWNRVQVKKRCCGVDGSWDYKQTDWYNNQNPIDAPVTTYVPDSCCVLNFNQDRDLYRVDPQNPQLKDPKRCQEDAAGRILNGANLNQKVVLLHCIK
jgi:hypothetical protein